MKMIWKIAGILYFFDLLFVFHSNLLPLIEVKFAVQTVAQT